MHSSHGCVVLSGSFAFISSVEVPPTTLFPRLLLYFSPGDEAAVKEEEDKKEEGGKDEKVELKCCVMLQKELAEGLTDEECGRAVEEGHAGLCE